MAQGFAPKIESEKQNITAKKRYKSGYRFLRRMAISLLNQETNSKRSLRQKTKRAAMNCNYMFDVLLTALK